MKLLVTGCAGFIGSHLSERLLKEGHDVIGIDNFDPFYDVRLKQKNIRQILQNESFKFYQGDIRDYDFLDRLLSKQTIDIVIHIAAKAGVRPSIDNPHDYFDVNVKGTLNILESMRKNSINKIVFASSSSVYGNNEKLPFSEIDNVDNPISPYAATKRSCELLLATYYHLHGINGTLFRFFTVYGQRQRPEMAIAKFTKGIYEKKIIELYANGESSRDYTHIDDIVEWVIRSLDSINNYKIINLGNSSPVKLGLLLQMIEKALKMQAKIKLMPRQPGDVEVTYADITLAAQLFNYSPQVRMEDGIKNYVDWFLEEANVIDN